MIGAVDIGGTKIAVGMIDGRGKILARRETPSGPELPPREGLDRILAMLRKTADQADEKLEGVGIGCTGPVDPQTGRLGRIEFLPGWEGVELGPVIRSEFGVTSALENDADAAALGEFTWGAGRGTRRFIYLTVSTGIGGGIILDGQLYRGVDGSHPELGHHVIDPAGPKCFCGAHGCWESLAGGPALAKRGNAQTAQEVCASAERGEASALAAVEREGELLGLGFANLIDLFIPDMIAFGGGVMQSFRLFQKDIERIIRDNCGLVPFEKTRLVPASLGQDVGLIGAAQVWVQHHGNK